MKNFTQNSKTTLIRWRYSLGMILMVVLMMPAIAVSQSPAPVNLGTAGNYVVLAKSGISTTGTTSIVGDIGVSPIDHTAITGFGLILDSSGQFSTSSLVDGRIYAADYAPPTPTLLTTAVSNMEAAYTDAAGRPADYTELYAGDLTGQTLTSGVYKWGTDVLISAGGVTISGSPTDVWIFQIAGNLTVANTAIVSLSGGAQASNIFWQVAGQTILGTTSDFSGIILCQTLIALQTGAAFDGRALSQTAVTLDGNNIVVGNPPVIACPMDIVANNDPGVCTANVNFANAIAIDEEDGIITTTQTMGPASGSDFPVGDTIIEFSATDSDGNTVTCQFTITIIDNEAPVAVCQDLTLDLDPVTGTVNITVADVDNGSTDNCGIASMTLDISSFDCSMTGANTVTMTVTDNSGNSTTCTATVTIQDVTAPEVFCVGGFGIFTESEDFEAGLPSGWSTVMNTGTCDWINSGNMPIGDDFPTLAMLFDDDDCGSGAPASNVSLLSAVYDLTGASNVTVDYDVAFQESGTQTFTVEVFDGAAWQQIALYDADLDPDIQTESVDVSAFVNATFQVRWTFDDNGGEWGWGAGVDNFLLTYEATSGGGLDVFLDANGMASVDPNDLVTGVNEACGYTITAGGVGGGTAGSLTTFFIGTNGGSSGWTVMYDVTVGPADIEVTELDINTTSTAAFDLDLYVLTGTYVGNETNAAAWGAVAASGSGTGAGTDLPSNVVLDAPVVLSANTTYGFAVVTTGVGQRYTNGDGTNQNFSNADLSMSLGTAVSGLFTGSVFTPRVWNGTVHYETVASSGLEFTCADLGENLVEVTVTDDSGNVSTCTAVVNVIDNIAPVLVCQDATIELGPDGTATIDPYDLIGSVVEACGIDTAAVDLPTVSCADIGTTILVTVFVTDASGNLASCSANITVVDLLAPVLTCPADQTVDPGVGNLFYILPDYIATGEAIAIDNCTDPVIITTQDPAPGTALSDGVYTITMTATDEYGNTSTCDFELTVESILGVNQNSLDAGVALYPNPASNVVNLVNRTNISLEKMMIYDINGKLVNQIDLRSMQGEKAVDVSSLAPGVYVVQIIGDNANTVKRLIKE